MPWKKAFDIDQTLTKAMDVFVRHGYRGASMQHLVKGMGINPGSIYATYGNKQALFLQALEQHRRLFERDLQHYSATLGPRDVIRAVFGDIVAGTSAPRGGLLVSASGEAGGEHAVAAAVAAGLQWLERFFEEKIRQGQQRGEIAGTVQAGPAAATLLTLFSGLHVLARVGMEADAVEPVLSGIDIMLDG